jgi:hypothetical protein
VGQVWLRSPRSDEPANLLPYEDEIRSVAVGYGEVSLAGGLEIAFARKREGGPEGTAPYVTQPRALATCRPKSGGCA